MKLEIIYHSTRSVLVFMSTSSNTTRLTETLEHFDMCKLGVVFIMASRKAGNDDSTFRRLTTAWKTHAHTHTHTHTFKLHMSVNLTSVAVISSVV